MKASCWPVQNIKEFYQSAEKLFAASSPRLATRACSCRLAKVNVAKTNIVGVKRRTKNEIKTRCA